VGITAGRHKADVLAVYLFCDRQYKMARQLASLGLGKIAQREAQEVDLLWCRRKQKIALVALLLAGAIERPPSCRQRGRGNVMPGRQHFGTKATGRRQQVPKLEGLIAVDTRDRSFTRHVAVGEAVHHRLLEATLIVENVMRYADAARHHARIVDILAGAAGAL